MKLDIIASALVLMGGWAVGVAASDMDVDGGGLLEEEMAREFQGKRMLAERAEVSNLMKESINEGEALGKRRVLPPKTSVDDTISVYSRAYGAKEFTPARTEKSALGGVTPEPITKSGDKSRPFEVNGNTFPTFNEAFKRSCDDQQNACADVANSQNNPSSLQVSQCQTQLTSCIAATATATQTGFNVLTSSNAEFDFFCDF
ncbi:neurofilament medium polypeptide protein [Rutstroemia sp. NJR-2017a WRK4]|nr:neurofilament medium polypeptide protein [Rutstroemia sp. NJR-2017a WRK4]